MVRVVKRALIAGIGDVGIATARELVGLGAEVHGLRRTENSLGHGITPIVGDMRDLNSLTKALLPPYDTVVFTASADARTPAAYRSCYVDGLHTLIDALAAVDSIPHRFLFSSSTAVYAQSAGEWINEQSAAIPTRFTGQVLLEAEAAIARAPFESVSVRFAGIYGIGRVRLLRDVLDGTAELSEHYTNRIHVQDCGRALAHLATLENPAPLYVAADDDPAPRREVHAQIAELLGVDPESLPVGSAAPANKRCDNRLLRVSGLDLEYPSFRDGYPAIVRDFLERRL